MKVEFLAPAQTELEEAIRYYNAQQEGLGFEFADEVEKAIQRTVEYPDAWASLSRRTRRCRTGRFPYGVIYQQKDDTILILAVMHLHRDPNVWKARLRKPRLYRTSCRSICL